MNILPLILALVLMLSVLTVEKLEKFKNHAIVQKEYQTFLKMGERQVFNSRQLKLYGESDKDIKQLSFRFLVDKEAKKKDDSIAKQYRLLNLELMKILYAETAFYKNLEQKRSNFLEEMLNAIEQAAEDAPENLIKRVEDIARLKLDDPELQEAFYRMLKGTVSRQRFAELKAMDPDQFKEKSYVSLFAFINYEGKKGVATIDVQHAPREILKAVFVNDDVVEAIITKRQELAKTEDNGASATFQNEFSEKRRPGLDDKLLNFKITPGDKSVYN